MRKIITILLILCTLLCLAFPAAAAEGRVTYSGNSGEFIFSPGSKESPADLFPDFKDLMPGDSVTQKLTVKNDADKEVKVDIYIRSLGAKEGSEEFLSQMRLKVAKSVDNKMEYMFDAAADQSGPGQLADLAGDALGEGRAFFHRGEDPAQHLQAVPGGRGYEDHADEHDDDADLDR